MNWTPALEQELRERIIIEYRKGRRRRYQAQCEGKHRFQTATLAYASIRHNDMQMFRCRFCGAWHVAHKRKVLNRSKGHA